MVEITLNKTLHILDNNIKEYCLDTIRAAVRCNINIIELADLEVSDWIKKWGNLKHKFGNDTNLARDIVPIVHQEDLAYFWDILGRKHYAGN